MKAELFKVAETNGNIAFTLVLFLPNDCTETDPWKAVNHAIWLDGSANEIFIPLKDEEQHSALINGKTINEYESRIQKSYHFDKYGNLTNIYSSQFGSLIKVENFNNSQSNISPNKKEYNMKPISHDFSDKSKVLSFVEDDYELVTENKTKEEILEEIFNNTPYREGVPTYFYFDPIGAMTEHSILNRKLHSLSGHAWKHSDTDGNTIERKWYIDGEEMTEEQHNDIKKNLEIVK